MARRAGARARGTRSPAAAPPGRRAAPRDAALHVRTPAPAAPVAGGARRWALVIAAAVLLAYANSFPNPFLLDDQRAILENPQIRQVWPLSSALSPPPETPVARRPLVNLSFALNYAAGGLEPAGYHAVNLGIHLLAALTLFGLVRRTLQMDRLAPRFGAHAVHVAGACALLWAVHPLPSEVINYVSQRTTGLMGLCYLLTLYCALRGLAPGHGRWRAGAVAACAAGMASKEAMVTAPLVVVLFDRVFVYGSLRAALHRRGVFYGALAGTWAILAALMATGGRSTVGFDAGVTPWTYFLNQFPVILTYLRLAVWPLGLVVDYGLPQALAPADVLWPAAAVVALGGAGLAALRYAPAAGFLGTMFFVMLAPTSSIVPIATEVGAERRMYLPLAAVVILLVCGAFTIGRLAPGARGDARPEQVRSRALWRAAAAATACLAALLAAATLARNREYASHESIARANVERRPHARAYYTLGHALFEAGQRDQALGYFRQAAAENFPGARFALGTEALADGNFEDGIAHLRAFVELAPKHPAAAGARQMIATAEAARGNVDEAIGVLRAALEIQPGDARGHALLGELLLRDGQTREAATHLERAIALELPDARTHDLLGMILARQGRLTDAVAQFERAAALDPDYAAARQNLARAREMLASAGMQSGRSDP